MIPPNIDVDRLHNVVSQITTPRYRGRREGKTTAYLMLMLGEVELGGPNNTYLYLGESSFFTAQVARAFIRLIKREHPLVLVELRTPEKVIVNETQQFFFVSAPRVIENPNKIRGWSIDRAFVDLDTPSQERLDHDGKLTELLQQLMIQLSYKHGDVV